MPASAPPRPVGFGAFLNLSRAIGSDILKTQGAGGNTSLKDGDVMWVKASGTWLSQAEETDIMVPVKVGPLVQALRAGDQRAEKATDFVDQSLNTNGLRPSIETSFHAALPHRVVAHYHCVNTIALAVQERRDALLAERTAKVPDLSFRTIPYGRPGVPLALEIDELAGEEPDVLILFNHGIIVGGETVAEVAERIDRLSGALATGPRAGKSPDFDALAEVADGTDFEPAAEIASHAPALDPVSMRVALGGVLYPDHTIFLGPSIAVLDLDKGQGISDLNAEFAKRGEPLPKMVLVPGKGVLLSKTLTPGGIAMARCLAEVVTRVPGDEKIVYLSSAQVHELSNWEAEQYRQALDRKVAGL
jgi:rhamnose utilization protein RhaD (predicted bifunctional aldolase and dehydrogenase)